MLCCGLICVFLITVEGGALFESVRHLFAHCLGGSEMQRGKGMHLFLASFITYCSISLPLCQYYFQVGSRAQGCSSEVHYVLSRHSTLGAFPAPKTKQNSLTIIS